MKHIYKIAIVTVFAVLAGGIIWWQLSKKKIIKNQIEKSVAKGTDSTYFIHYDSSHIDELAGNAVFYNIVLQSDSLQKKLYTDDTSDIAKTIVNVHIEKLQIEGANLVSFLKKNTIEAKSIEIIRPVISLINTGKADQVKFTSADTLALYEKITGKFKSIKASEIKITDGTIAFARGTKSPHATLRGVNINLKNLKIDSTRNYDNIISYFIKDITATVKNINIKNDKAGRVLIFEGAEYNAPGRFLKINKFLQNDIRSNKNLIMLQNSRVSGLSTNAFIVHRQLKADSLTTDGGVLGFYRRKKKDANETIELDNGFFDEAIVKNIRLGSTEVSLYNKANKNEPPMVFKNLKFNASGIDSIYSGTDLVRLAGDSKWDLSADGFSFTTKDKMYKINLGAFILDKARSVITMNSLSVLPLLNPEEFMHSLKFQKDYFNIRINNIRLSGADVKKLVAEKTVIANELSLQAFVNIFNDRTVKPDTASKMGQYPHQLLREFKTPIYVKTVKIINGNVVYKERGAISKKTGDAVFNKINLTIANLTNIKEYVSKNDQMILSLKCKFLNMADISSLWKLPLNPKVGEFAISVKVGSFDGVKLNPVIEPLGMGSIKSGFINSYNFNLQGTDTKGSGDALLLYNNLKIKLLKYAGDSNNLQTKGVTSFAANLLIKDKNPAQAVTRKGKLDYKRTMSKSFFNLVWKSIFAGAKTSIR